MTRHFRTRALVLGLCLGGGVLLAACDLLFPTSPTTDPVATAAAATVAARLTESAQREATQTAMESAVPTEPAVPTEAGETPTPSPTPEPTEKALDPNCDRIGALLDVTVPDNTEFLPGESFTKVWRMRNAGECAWTTDYALVFDSGDQLGGPDEIPLKGTVPAGGIVDLEVDLKAPNTPKTYRGNWKLRNADGFEFGLGEEADKPFWVQINVVSPDEELELDEPTWRDRFTGGKHFYLLTGPDIFYTIQGGNLVMEAVNKNSYDQWGLSDRPSLEDFYLEMTALTGPNCSGKDRYGVLVRAPDPSQGYVFSFSCDGRYRLYAWDGSDFTGIVGWTKSNRILAGPNQSNRLGFWVEGDTIKLYANRRLLKTLTDGTYTKGRFGLVMGAPNTAGFTVYVDEVAYWLLED